MVECRMDGKRCDVDVEVSTMIYAAAKTAKLRRPLHDVWAQGGNTGSRGSRDKDRDRAATGTATARDDDGRVKTASRRSRDSDSTPSRSTTLLLQAVGQADSVDEKGVRVDRG